VARVDAEGLTGDVMGAAIGGLKLFFNAELTGGATGFLIAAMRFAS
jgi:hypothetical protein